MWSQKSDLELAIQIVPQGDTEPEEIAELTPRVTEALGQLDGVLDVDRSTSAAPAHTKAGTVIDFGSILTSVLPDFVKGAIGGVVQVLTGAGTPPAKIKVKVPDREIEVEFNPKTISAEEIGALAQLLVSGSAEAG